MKKTLTLRSETLAALTADELALVQGAAASGDSLTALSLLTCQPPCHTVA